MEKKLLEHILYVGHSHSEKPLNPEKAFRNWDKKTPYFLHPLWCASTLATETTLPEEIRQQGIVALLYHDVLEDTFANLPASLTLEVQLLIKDLSFSGFEEEVEKIWEKSSTTRLLKLYDKVSNLMDSSWMEKDLLKKYLKYTKKLLEDVQQNFGELNITQITKAIIADLD